MTIMIMTWKMMLMSLIRMKRVGVLTEWMYWTWCDSSHCLKLLENINVNLGEGERVCEPFSNAKNLIVPVQISATISVLVMEWQNVCFYLSWSNGIFAKDRHRWRWCFCYFSTRQIIPGYYGPCRKTVRRHSDKLDRELPASLRETFKTVECITMMTKYVVHQTLSRFDASRVVS